MINNKWKVIERSVGTYLPTSNSNQFINLNTKVCLMGSCFADEIGWVLKEFKINIGEVGVNKDLKHVLYPWGTFFSPLNLSDILELVMNNKIEKILDEKSFFKVPKNLTGNNFDREDEEKNIEKKLINFFVKGRTETDDYEIAKKEIKDKFNKLYNSIVQADVVIITLGLIETWIDNEKKIAWHSFHGNPIKKKSYKDLANFHTLDISETINCLRKILKLINPSNKKKIIFTVSPIPMYYTFSEKDVVVANRYSKSVLRASVEQLVDNKSIFYFPSFEIVLDCVGWPKAFKEDKRHVKPEVFKNYIQPVFLKTFFQK